MCLLSFLLLTDNCHDVLAFGSTEQFSKCVYSYVHQVYASFIFLRNRKRYLAVLAAVSIRRSHVCFSLRRSTAGKSSCVRTGLHQVLVFSIISSLSHDAKQCLARYETYLAHSVSLVARPDCQAEFGAAA